MKKWDQKFIVKRRGMCKIIARNKLQEDFFASTDFEKNDVKIKKKL